MNFSIEKIEEHPSSGVVSGLDRMISKIDTDKYPSEENTLEFH